MLDEPIAKQCVNSRYLLIRIVLKINALVVVCCVRSVCALDKGFFVLYLCTDVLINYSVNPVERSRQLVSWGPMAGS